MMLPMSCDPPFCSNAGDDNVYITPLAASPGSTITSYSQLDSSAFTIFGPRNGSVIAERGLLNTSDIGDSWRSSKSHIRMTTFGTLNYGALRCAVAIED